MVYISRWIKQNSLGADKKFKIVEKYFLNDIIWNRRNTKISVNISAKSM